MQLHLQLSGNFSLPLNYRHHIQSMLYHALRTDPAYSTSIHDGGNIAQNRHFKLFTFGQLEGKYRIADRQICFPEGAALEIRSIHDDLLLRLFRYFTPGQHLHLGHSRPSVTHSFLTNDIITTDSISIRTCSPIVAYVTHPDNRTQFFSPEEPEFYTLVSINARRKWHALHGDSPDFAFAIAPLENSHFRKQVTLYKTTRLTAWDGQFSLQAPADVLNLLYHTGLGAKSSQGFGMFSTL